MSAHHGDGYELRPSRDMADHDADDDLDAHDSHGPLGPSRHSSLDQQHKTLLTTTTSASPGRSPRRGFLHRGHAKQSPRHTFLRAIGLKIAASWVYKREDPKPVVSGSRSVALQRLGVHLLPAVFTLLVLLMNIIGVYNGPVISAGGNFALQVASKFHELAITGSLTAIISDIVIHKFTKDGIGLGLLTSAFQFSGLNFLWSSELWSNFSKEAAARAKVRVLMLLVVFCLLASFVGPLSALLFLPIQLWQPSGGTEYYLAGTQDQLWPQRLTANHTGPQECSIVPPLQREWCLTGGWRSILGNVPETTGPNVGGWDYFAKGNLPPRIIQGHRPDTVANYMTGSKETWIYALHAAQLLQTEDLGHANEIAFQVVQDHKKRKLRDFVDGRISLGEGPIALARTVCAAPQVMQNDTKSVNFPVLPLNANWRTKTGLASQSDGPTKAVDVESLPTGWPSEYFQAQSRWITLPDGFGATAGLIFVSHNPLTTVVRGCAVDARWAPGQYLQGRQASLFSWQPYLGDIPTPDSDANIQLPAPIELFGSELKDRHSPTLKADQAWLDALAPPSAASQPNSNFTMSTFDSLLNVTILNNPSFGTESNASINADFPRILLEYITNIYFVDALSRIGLNLQYTHDPVTGNPVNGMIDAPLRLPIPGDPPDRILYGGPLFARPPAGFDYTVMHHNWYRYGQAWILHDYPQYVSVAVLLFHLLLVLLHAGFMLWRGESSDTWDSIAELITLAYNSGRGPGGEGVVNVGAGIRHLSTLNKVAQVRETAAPQVDSEYLDRKVELVISDRGVDDRGHRVALDQEYS